MSGIRILKMLLPASKTTQPMPTTALNTDRFKAALIVSQPGTPQRSGASRNWPRNQPTNTNSAATTAKVNRHPGSSMRVGSPMPYPRFSRDPESKPKVPYDERSRLTAGFGNAETLLSCFRNLYYYPADKPVALRAAAQVVHTVGAAALPRDHVIGRVGILTAVGTHQPVTLLRVTRCSPTFGVVQRTTDGTEYLPASATPRK
jgi:hypothetical protein